MQQRHTSDLLSLLFLLLMCGGIVVSVIFYHRLQQSNEQLVENAKTIDSLNIRLQTANHEILEMLRERDSLANAAPELNEPPPPPPPVSAQTNGHTQPAKSTPASPEKVKSVTDMLQKALTIESSIFDVAVYAYNCPDAALRNATDFLYNNGYRTIDTFTLASKPSWFASQPTVFYYSDKNKSRVAVLVSGLQKTTGLRFRAQRGAGYGVAKGTEDYTLKIHLIQ